MNLIVRSNFNLFCICPLKYNNIEYYTPKSLCSNRGVVKFKYLSISGKAKSYANHVDTMWEFWILMFKEIIPAPSTGSIWPTTMISDLNAALCGNESNNTHSHTAMELRENVSVLAPLPSSV